MILGLLIYLLVGTIYTIYIPYMLTDLIERRNISYINLILLMSFLPFTLIASIVALFGWIGFKIKNTKIWSVLQKGVIKGDKYDINNKKRKWVNNKMQSNTFNAYAYNEEEYRQLIGDLTVEHDVYHVCTADVWIEKEILIEDWEAWHNIFRTTESKNYDLDEFTNPVIYKDGIELKPKNDEYPIVLSFINGMCYDCKKLYWISLNEIK